MLKYSCDSPEGQQVGTPVSIPAGPSAFSRVIVIYLEEKRSRRMVAGQGAVVAFRQQLLVLQVLDDQEAKISRQALAVFLGQSSGSQAFTVGQLDGQGAVPGLDPGRGKLFVGHRV